MAITRVTFEEARRVLETEGAVYLDVRSVPEFESGHAPGAFNVPLLHAGPAGMQPNPNFVAEVEAAIPTDTTVVVGCRSGGRSARAAAQLVTAGYSALHDYVGGWGGGGGDPGWSACGGPSTTTAEPGRSHADLKL